MLCPLMDLSKTSPQSKYDAISTQLGIPWEHTKDINFSHEVPFTGFLWNLEFKMVSLPDKKKAKYLAEICQWELHPVHTLERVQKFYGKLLHICHVIPSG